MGFVGNLLLFAAVKRICKSIDKVTPMVRVSPFLTHSVCAIFLVTTEY